MLTKEQYLHAGRLVASYLVVAPAPDSRYGRRLVELLALIEEYEIAQGHEIAHGLSSMLTHADIQARVDAKRGVK